MNGRGSPQPPKRQSVRPPEKADETVACAASIDSSTELDPYLPGEVIGDRYQLVHQLGRGGMGVVWVAHALTLGVDVAVKLIRVSVAGSAVAARMAREAHAAARLGHPALVRVFDFGWTSCGDPFLVMELVQGETLSAILERELSIDPARTVQILLPIADGLRLAHEHTIVHRDIKPENIFIAADALGRIQPKLLDFGIAKVELSNSDLRLTQVGVALGSPEYMSPEQAQGIEDVDARTDVWSLAVVLFEMVSGNLPFNHGNYNGLMQAIIHDPPEPIPDDLQIDSALWQIIERGLSKHREERWSSMTEFGEALALWLYERGTKEDISGNSIRAVWLDGHVSKVDHASQLPVSERLQRGSSDRAKAFKARVGATTTEAVAHKRRRTARVVGQRWVHALVGCAVLGAIVAAGLMHNNGVSGFQSAIQLTQLDLAFGNSVRSEVLEVLRRCSTHARSAISFGEDPRHLPMAPETAVAKGAGTKDAPWSSTSEKTRSKVKKPSKPRRDFGF
jgi:eukaryotic-like serine/threonine-protein kinase